ncbi:MAG: hypothetical protein JXB29_11385 [Sedimentisphaerales bacterium]|nr:hypothetical protein [Sedimentisphaerales bacterium]
MRQEVHAKEPENSSNRRIQHMNIITLAFDMANAVEVFMQKAKKFFYSVMLFGHRCPECTGLLVMYTEGKCRCVYCGKELDPTVAFQRCPECGGVPVLRIRRYQCKNCGSDIQSRFLFDGLVFDADYFRNRMIESRQRKAEQRKRVRQMLAESRSADLPLGAVDLTGVPGLLDALNGLTAGLDVAFAGTSRDEFDLKHYETHIKAHIQDFPVRLTDIPPLSDDPRKDLIWRFIAVIFLAHAGIVNIWQDGHNIMVMKHETNRKRQDVLGEFEESDGVERPMGRIVISSY